MLPELLHLLGLLSRARDLNELPNWGVFGEGDVARMCADVKAAADILASWHNRAAEAVYKNVPVCRYLLASGKAGAEEKYGTDPVYRRVLVELPLVCEKHPMIAYEVARSARTGFRGRSAEDMSRIRARRGVDRCATGAGDQESRAQAGP